MRVKLQRGPHLARLSVEDRGIGIPERDLERVFDRFACVGVGREVGGLGIGLHISRAIVEAHAGAIRVESAVGRGSTFTIELPAPASLDDAELPRGCVGSSGAAALDGQVPE